MSIDVGHVGPSKDPLLAERDTRTELERHVAARGNVAGLELDTRSLT